MGPPLSEEFSSRFKAFAERSVNLSSRCLNEESTKLFLILPFLHFLGYDDRNPDEVCPEHAADFSEKYKNRVDFAILKNGTPVIAIECKAVGLPLKDERGQLRSYFNAAPSVKMGVITDGIIYEFYADSNEKNMMDLGAFLTVDMREIAKGKIENSIEEGLKGLQKLNFDPDNIGAEAKRKLVFNNMVQQIGRLAEDPSEAFVRLLLQNAGLQHVRQRALNEFHELTKSAFREFINLKILRRLDLPTKEIESEKPVSALETMSGEAGGLTLNVDGIVTTDLELSVFAYAKRRLSFLVKDEALFEEIENIVYRDYRGKFVVYYKKERAGRLFEFYENGKKKFWFDFGDFGGELITDKLSDIDNLLLAVFLKRVNDLAVAPKSPRLHTKPDAGQ